MNVPHRAQHSSTSLSAILTLIAVIAVQLPVGGQSRRQQQSPSPSPESTAPLVLKSIRNDKLAAAFHTGHLPEPLRKPDGTPDEVAAVLAKSLAGGDDQSMPALLTALMTAGFGIRENDGGVTQTVQPGQGLIFEAWEVAAMAKMYGEQRTVEPSYLSDALTTIPELKQAPLEKILVEGIRKQAVSEHPELRFWARFIVELGKRAAHPYDLLNPAHDKRIRLDAIQNALILRRVQGDIYSLGKHSEQGLRRYRRSPTVATARLPKKLYAHVPQTQPCTLSETEATVADIQALGATTAFDELMSYVKDKIGGSSGGLFGKYGRFAKIANILLAYAKFILTYASLETEIKVENAPLIRNTSVAAGQSRKLTAKVSMNIGKWQQVNCIRWLLNYGMGLDFNLMNDGPVPGVTVNWHLTSGGAADFYHSGDRDQQIVWFTGTGPRIQEEGTYAGIGGKEGTPVGNLAKTKTDTQGKAHIILEGASRRNHVRSPHLPVMKKAVVETTIKLKGGDLKGDAVDLVGHLSGGFISLAKKEGLSDAAAGMFTLPLELLYRTDWASKGMIEVPVKDWETCGREGWEGTITYTKEFNYSWTDKNDQGQSTNTRKESYTATMTFGGMRISPSGIINVANANVVGSASYNEKYNSISNQACRRPLERTTELSGDSQNTSTAAVHVMPNMQYQVNYQLPSIIVDGYHVSSWRLEGDCKNPFMSKSGGSKTVMARQIVPGQLKIDGVIDPNNPQVLTGTKTQQIERDRGITTITVSWNISHCKPQ